MPEIKKVVWLGSSLKDLRELPEMVQGDIGYALWRVQEGKHHADIKPLKGLSSVFEIRVDYDRDTYRAVYTINIGDVIYVLHVFKKKSKKGSVLPKEDGDLIQSRLKWAKELANEKKSN
jgi:phage-related protein